jgi:sulfur carrier protein ThiS
MSSTSIVGFGPTVEGVIYGPRHGNPMARITFSGKVHEIPPGETLEAFVSSLGLHPDSFVFVIGGTPVPMDIVPPGDSEVRALRVASGG